ncbi:hypothetical protein EV138_5345 [Kribbella voronezhensis]|uniref:Galactose mutarotase-like enzyme n=1 Tax=Kribbella voronezhensis TaxID=2512212 RepID=A0A4R7THC4_9ACTN|nr:hypothetical protein [Kribbella voronezhensis]TDU91732.1 hypothetical protein EV138_5345 [Kribbella voronezhensis]
MVTELPLPANEVTVDLDDGGRWTSLFLGGREWLWTGPGLLSGPRTGRTSYVDVGGLDECFPTVRGTPDHGGLWNQPWGSLDEDDDWDVVQYGDAVLLRRFNGGETPAEITETGAIWADYRLIASPGYRFTWTAHALLDCSVGTTLIAPACTICRLYPEAAPLLNTPSLPWTEASWPSPGGIELETYGPTDGSAVGGVLVDLSAISVRDGNAELTLSLSCPEQPTSVAVWRNLGGFPERTPYRSLGVEPMLGRVFDLAEAGPGDAATVPASGELTWRLVVSARPV